MMKHCSAFLLLCLASSAAGAPVVVWKQGADSPAVHSSDVISAADCITDALKSGSEQSTLDVVFLLGRGESGSESLTTFASQGSLPGVASLYENAHTIHHHVSGIESPFSVTRDASRSHPGRNVLQISLSEYYSKISSPSETVDVEVSSDGGMVSKAAKHAGKRARALAKANVLIVNIDATTPGAEIDSAVVSAVENKAIGNVVLAGVRSVEEVKLERGMQDRRRMQKMQDAGKHVLSAKARRLAQNEGDDANNNGNNANNNDLTGIYYVSMTPNILAGILFFLLFSVTTFIGISCMGMIQGQDVYVTKMPSIGREA